MEKKPTKYDGTIRVDWLMDHQTTRKEKRKKAQTKRKGAKQGRLVVATPNDQEGNEEKDQKRKRAKQGRLVEGTPNDQEGNEEKDQKKKGS